MRWIIRLLTVAGLGVDAYIHIYHGVKNDMGTEGGMLSESKLFLYQGIVAAVVALVLLVRANRATYLLAFLVAGSAAAALVLYRYVDVGALGPLPDMYEPQWYTEKIVTVLTEGVATLTALIGLSTVRPAASRREPYGVNRDPSRIPG